MPAKFTEREYRYFQPLQTRSDAAENNGFTVEGYASTYDPYVLFEDEDGIQYKEQILPGAFDGADFSDTIMQYDHSGYVFARTRNKTLIVTPDEKGLYIRADLSKTTHSREMYEDIAAGNVDQMSFAFIVDRDHYDPVTHTRYIDSFRKIYDVSAVSLPANPTTEIGVATRSAFDGFINAEKQELLKREARHKKAKALELKLRLINGD